MKRSITQGRFAEFLNSAKGLDRGGHYFIGATAGETSNPNDPKLHYARFHGLAGYTITTNAMGEYVADVPDRACCFLSWPDIKSYASWAGLRPPTNLEYEKACRGPRDFAREEDAWTEGICAPFDSAPDFVKEPRRGGPDIPADPGPSYWGIRQLSLSGCSHEWPGTIGNGIGRMALDFRGTHGNGMPNAPGDWPPTTAFGEWFYMSWEAGGATAGFADIGIWVLPSQMSRVGECLRGIDSDRTGRYGAHAVRTAPITLDKNAPLQIDKLPVLRDHDIGVFYLSGSFRNDGDKPLKVELVSPLPGACFPACAEPARAGAAGRPEGAASLAFTAQPKTPTPFKILTVLTCDTAAAALRGGRKCAVRIQTPDGGLLAEQSILLTMKNPGNDKPVAIRSLEGGEAALSILNATDQSCAVAVEMSPPPGLALAAKTQRVELAARSEKKAVFGIPPQAFAGDGPVRLPYRVTVLNGAPQSGETAVALQVQSRWWISLRTAEGPKMGADIGGGEEVEGTGLEDIVARDRPAGVPDDLFKFAKPSKGWREVVGGGSVSLDGLGAVPPRSSALAAAKIVSPGERNAVIGVEQRPAAEHKGTRPRFAVRAWLNDKIVYDAGRNDKTPAETKAKPFQLRKGVNTLVVECRSEEDAPVNSGAISVRFTDPATGKPVEGLVLDMEKR
jgi:hypothetical protein